MVVLALTKVSCIMIVPFPTFECFDTYALGDIIVGKVNPALIAKLYNFILNNAHPSFKWVQERDAEIRESYFQEQMIYHAYKLAHKDEVFEGPLSPFRDKFIDAELSPHEVAESFDEVVGMALKRLKA